MPIDPKEIDTLFAAAIAKPQGTSILTTIIRCVLNALQKLNPLVHQSQS